MDISSSQNVKFQKSQFSQNMNGSVVLAHTTDRFIFYYISHTMWNQLYKIKVAFTRICGISSYHSTVHILLHKPYPVEPTLQNKSCFYEDAIEIQNLKKVEGPPNKFLKFIYIIITHP